MRCFVALPLPGEARALLSDLARDLSRGRPGISWTKSEGYHLTLAFLGEIEGATFECAAEAVAGLRESAFSFRFAGLDGFPPRPPWRVLYVRMEDRFREPVLPGAGVPCGDSAALADPEGGPIERIYRAVNEALVASAHGRGLEPPNREWRAGGRVFVPHVTLARIPDRRRGGRGAPKAGGAGAFAGRPSLGLAQTAASVGSALAGQWTIDRCSLYKSELRPEGARYTEMESAVLNPAPDGRGSPCER